MTWRPIAISAALSGLFAGGALAATPQPPMNDFNSAFYRCAGAEGGAFNMSYDGPKPKSAVMKTSQQARYEMKREKVAEGVLFKGDGVTFWTDGMTTRVDGGKQPYVDCKRDT